MNYNNLIREQTKKIFLTKNGLNNIKMRLDNIRTRRREVIRKVKQIAGIDRDALDMTAQIHELETIEMEAEQLNRALQQAETIVQPKNPHTVTLGCTVGLKSSEVEVLYTIVSPLEMDIENNMISEESLLGKAVLGKTIGDEFSIMTPRGTITTYKVTSIS